MPVKAVDYLTVLKTRHGLGVVATNNSWGVGGYSQALYDAIELADKANILFVAAAGNGGSDGVGDDNDTTPHYPSSYTNENVIAVASITSTGDKSSFSNYGATSVDLGAPGSGIYSTLPSNSYGSYSGTSMATPHVTGGAALYAASHSAATAEEIKTAILGAPSLPPRSWEDGGRSLERERLLGLGIAREHHWQRAYRRSGSAASARCRLGLAAIERSACRYLCRGRHTIREESVGNPAVSSSGRGGPVIAKSPCRATGPAAPWPGDARHHELLPRSAVDLAVQLSPGDGRSGAQRASPPARRCLGPRPPSSSSRRTEATPCIPATSGRKDRVSVGTAPPGRTSTAVSKRSVRSGLGAVRRRGLTAGIGKLPPPSGSADDCAPRGLSGGAPVVQGRRHMCWSSETRTSSRGGRSRMPPANRESAT